MISESPQSLTAYKGCVCVLLPSESQGPILVPEIVRRDAELKYDAPIETRWGVALSSGRQDIRAGERVLVRCDFDGLALERSDYDFIPEGYEVRCYTKKMVEKNNAVLCKA